MKEFTLLVGLVGSVCLLSACDRTGSPPPYLHAMPQATSLHYGPQPAPPTASPMQTRFSATHTYQTENPGVGNNLSNSLGYGN